MQPNTNRPHLHTYTRGISVTLTHLHTKLSLPVFFLTLAFVILSSASGFAANEAMTQTDWSGGNSTVTAIHPTNKTGWNKYDSKEANINTTQAGKVTLSPASTGITETSDTDFNAGVYSHTEVTGTGASAGVKLTATTQDPFSSSLNSWLMPQQLPKGVGAGGALCYPGTGDFIYAIKGHYTKEFLQYSVSLKRWYHLTDLPKPAGPGADLVYYNGDIYYMQGNGWTGFYKYTIASSTWTTLASTTEAVNYAGKLVYALWSGNPTIFASVGKQSTAFLAYNISTNQWSSAPGLPVDANEGTYFSWTGGNYLYYSVCWNQDFYRLDLTTNLWTAMVSTLGPCEEGAALAYDGGNYIYLVRGLWTNNFDRYSISGNTWEVLAHTPERVCMGGDIVYNANNSTFYAWGGGYGDEWYPELWEYNAAANKWTPVSYTLDYFRNGASLCFDGTDYVYALGGDYGYTGARARKFYRYSTSANVWTQLADAPNDVENGAALAYAGGYVYALRGGGDTAFWQYNPGNNTWAVKAVTPDVVNIGGSLVYPGSGDLIYALAGGGTNKFWLYTISTDTWSSLAVAPQNISAGADLVYYSPGTGDYIYCSAGNASGYFLRYSVTANTWATLTNCPQNVTWGGNLAYPGSGDSIYATVGGETPHFLKFSISGNSWEYLEPMPFNRRVENGGALVYGGNNYLYAARGFGGRDFGRYSLATGKWDTSAVVNANAYRGDSLAKAGSYLYLLQGHYTKGFSRYSLTLDKWEYLASLPKPAGDGAALAYTGGDYIYALAGSYQKYFYRYTISTDTWTELNPALNAISQGGSLVWTGGDYLYALRGESQDFYRYTISTNAWDSRAFTPAIVNYGSALLAWAGGNDIYCARGNGTNFWHYNIGTNIWTSKAAAPEGLEEGSSIVYPGTGDYIYCVQGDYNLGWSGFWRYSISADNWARLARTPINVTYGSAISCSGDYIYLIPGTWLGTKDFLQYSIANNIWTAASDGRYLSAGQMAVVNGDIYSLQAGNSAPFYRYSPSLNTWTSLSSLPANAATGASLAYVKNSDYIYALRGNNSNDFYRYSLTNNSWQRLTDTPSNPAGGASLAYPGTGDYIYALRGNDSSDFWRYSITNNLWEIKTAVPGLVSNGGELVSDGGNYLYTMRGANVQEFYRYSISGNSWSSLANTPASVGEGGSLCYPGFGDYIYAIRGYSFSSQVATNDFWRYAISTNTWEQLTGAPRGMWGGSSLVYPGGNYLYAKLGACNYLFRYLLFASGTFTSQAKEAGKNGGFGTITWTDSSDNKDSMITVKARTANDSGMSSALAWSAAPALTKGSDLSAYASVSDGNSYLQYQADYKTSDLTKIPQLNDLTFNYDYYPAKQELISSAYNTTTTGNRLMKLSWNKTLPQGTDLRFQLRTAQDSAGVPGSWGSWLGPIGTTFITNDFSTGNDYSSSSLVKLASGTAQPKKELEDLQYKQPITLDNTAGGAKSNVVVQVSLSVANDVFWSHVNSSGNDVRFFDGTQKLAYNLTSFDYTKKTALINVKIPSIAAGEVKTVYMLYGSSNAISESDPTVLSIPAEGLLGWWKMDEGSGTSAADSSTGGNSGTLTNGPTWVAGKFGSAVNFDGSNDYVSVASIPSGAQATMEAWIKPSGTNYASAQSIMGGFNSDGVGGDLSARYLIQVAGTNVNGEWSIYLSDGIFVQIVSSGLVYNAGNFPAGVWAQLSVTYDGTNVKFYKDGVLVKTVAQTVSAAGDAQPFAIGRLGGYSGGNPGQYFSGAIDSVKIYSRAFSAAEISALYQGPSGITVTVSQSASVEEAITSTVLGASWPYRKKVKVTNSSPDTLANHQVGVDFPSNNTGLVGSWQFNESAGTTTGTTVDVSGSGNNGTLNGFTSPNGVVSTGKFGNGMSFDGVDDYVNCGNGASLNSSAYTLEAWFKTTATSTDSQTGQRLITIFAVSNGTKISIMMRNNIPQILWVKNDNTTIEELSTNVVANDGMWHHLVGTSDGNTFTVYFDGAQKNIKISNLRPEYYNVSLGSRGGIEGFFNGSIDAVRIYNRALSAQEILDNYNGAKRADLRFIWINPANGSEQLISHWAESDSKDWVKIPSMAAYSTQTMYMYYGNPSALSTSNFDNVFTKDYGESGLRGLWHFDENSGTTAADSSGNGNNGTLTNGPAWQASDGGQWGSRSDVKFSTGSSLQFDGVDDYVNCGSGAGLDVTDAVTLEMWIKIPAMPAGEQYLLWRAPLDTNSRLFIYLDPTVDRLNFGTYANSVFEITYAGFSSYIGNWVHVAGTYDKNAGANNMKLYINGALADQKTYTRSIPAMAGENLLIGTGGGFFNGSIDEVRIYNRALSTGEIARHYLRSKYASPAVASTLFNYTETANTYSLANYYANNPVIQPVFGAFYNNDLAEFQETASKPAGTEIKYQVSPNGYRWYWWNGASWALVAGGYSEANTAATINSNLATFMSQIATSGEFFYRAYLHSDTGTAIPLLDQIRIATAVSTSYYLDSTGATAINILNTDAFNDQWFQYKATLYSSGKDTPILDDVTLEYINALITITSPNTAVIWQIGSAQNITWTSAGLPTGDTVKISYSTDAGSTWTLIAASVTAANGTYPWTVPEAQSAQARIKVVSNSLPAVYDISDVNFTIGGIKIVSPNSGETWEIATNHNITWTSVGTVSNQLIIEYSKDDFATPILIADQQANDGMYTWTVPNDVSNNAKIRIRDTVSPFASDTSDLNLKVQPVPQITVSAPNGGESWQVGSQHNITWSANSAVSNNLKFEYSKDDFVGDIHEINNFQVVLPGWNYSIPVTINNSTNTNNLTDYQVKMSIDSTLSSFWSHVKSDGSDIRFYDYNPTTALAYWVETFDYANKSAVVWVKIPLIPASSSKIINLCYGNPSSVSLSSFDNVFPTGYPETGLVGLWHFSEGQGTITRDASGSNNNGTLNFGTSWSSSGKISNALVFDGVDDYVQLPFYLSKPQIEATGMSWGMWVKTTTSKAVLIRQDNDGAGTYERSGGLGILNGKVYYILYNGARYVRPTSTKSINDNAWHYVVGVFTLDNYMQIYVDGELENTLYAESAGDSGYRNIRVAAGDVNDPTEKLFFSGAIDEVRVYNRPLSAEEVKAQYKRRKTTTIEPTASFGAEKGNVAVAPALPYYKVITINNSGAALTDYQFKITLDSSDTSFWSHVKSDAGDIRIYDNALAELAYWVESFNYAGKSAVIWVKLPSVPASATKKINLYYGSPSLTTVSNYDNVFTKDYGESGLVGLWHLDEGSENTVVDASGNANNGTFHGRVGLSFDGVDDYVNCGNGASLNVTDAITVEAWVKILSGVGGGIVTKGVFSGPATNYKVEVDSHVIYAGFGNGTAQTQIIGTKIVDDNVYHHIIFTYDKSFLRLYVDGQSDAAAVASSETMYLNNEVMKIGKWGGEYFFKGYIDNVRIYNRALSAAEVTEHYNGTYSNETGLVGNWQMNDGGTSQAVADSSGSGNNGTRGAASAVEGTDPAWFTDYPVWQAQDGGQWGSRSDVKFNTGSALSFDGVDDYVQVPSSALTQNSYNNLSVAAWIKRSGAGDWETIVSTGGWNSNRLGYTFRIEGTDNPARHLMFDAVFTDGTTTGEIETNDSIDDLNWHYVCATYDGTVRLYIDGQLKATSAAFNKAIGGRVIPFTIGQIDVGGNRFSGMIDDIRVYNRTLSGEEILALYERRKYALTVPAYSVGTEQANPVTTANFLYNKLVTINNSGNANALTDYQVRVALNNSQEFFWSHVKSDGSDIRFYEGAAELSYWIETFDYTNRDAVLWVKVPSVPASSSKTITLYYGNSSAAEGADFSNTFTKYFEGTISPNGLVGNWLMNESSGTTTADSSGNANTGTLYGPSRPTGLSFDGVDDYVNCGNGASLNITNAITLEAWVYPTSNSTDQGIISKGAFLGNYGAISYQVGIQSNGNVRFYGTGGAVIVFETTTNQFNLNQWNHIVGTWNGSAGESAKLYINGNLKTTDDTANGTLNTISSVVNIGGTTRLFSGSIDEVRVYNRALTAGEITNNYNGQVVRDASLVMEQRMGEGSGTTLNDNSGNNNNGTISGATWVASSRKLAKGHSGNYLEFDGKNDYVSTSMSFSSPSYITTEFWIKNKISANWQWILNGGQYITNGSYSIVRPNNSNSLQYRYADGTTSTANVTAANIFSGYDDTFFHVAIVADYIGNQVTFYRNGVYFSSGAMINPVKPITTYTRFGIYETSLYPFNGSIDDVKIYNRALSAQEISEQYEIGRGPVGVWNFDEGTGLSTVDASGNDNTGTLVNGPVWQSDAKFSSGASLGFDGVNDYVDCGNGASLNITNAITVEAWVKLNSYPIPVANGGQAWQIISKGTSPNSMVQWYIGTTGNLGEGIVRYFADIGGVWRGGPASLKIPLNQWIHLVASYDGATMFQYVNGTSVGTPVSVTGQLGNDANNLKIGTGANNRFINGSIDEVRIYNRALTVAEIQAHYRMRKYILPEPAASMEGDDGGSSSAYLWTIPDDVSGTVKVRITDNNRPTCTDKSDNNFSITQPTLTVTSPNGGEVWVNGDTHNITWTTSGQVSNTLKFEYSKDNFVSDVHLINSLWPYYQTITIDNSGNSKALYDYQAKVSFNSTAADFWSGVYPDGSDIRFYDGATELSYWTETFDYANKNAVLWVKVPSVPASSSKTITLKSGASGGGSNFSNTFTKNPEGTISTSGLVGNWLMNEASGTTTADSSGSANTGTLYGPARPTGLSFDGVNDYVNCGNGASLNITGDLTVEAWIKPNANGSYTSFVTDNGNDNTRAFCLEYNALTPRFVLGTGTTYVTANGSAISLDNYSHIVGTVSGTTMTIYVNGVASSPGTFAGSRQNINSINIGARPTQSSYFNGTIDEVRIYNRALTAGEITNNYNGSVVRDASLVMEQRMGEGSGTTLNDNSGNNNNGTISGATWVASDRKLSKGHIGNYLEFDGKNDYVDAGNAASLNFGTNNFSVAFWVKQNTYVFLPGVVWHGNPENADGFYIRFDGADSIQFLVRDGVTFKNIVKTIGTGSSWNYVVAQLNNGFLELYSNGIDLGGHIAVTSPNSTTSMNLIIGKDPLSGRFFNGSLDDVKIYNRALSAAEISEQYEIGRGLVGAWHFDEASGTTVADSSGQGNTGTLVNGPTWDAADGGQWGARSDVKFNSGSALSFDGVNDYVDCGNAASLNITNAITVEAWVYLKQDKWSYIISKGYGTDNALSLGYHETPKQWILHRYYGGIADNFYFGSQLLNQWVHITITGDLSLSTAKWKAYQNGILVGTNNWGNSVMSFSTNLDIGGKSGGRYFNGSIDEVRIYNRALSAGEIQTHYQRRKPTLPEPAISSLATASQDGLLSNSYPWGIPNDPSSTVKVRITDNARPAVTDSSDNNFQILGYSSIVLTSPNGSETLIMGDSHNITWVSYGAGVSNDLKLEYSTNNGAAWALIADQQANDGTYSWTVPNIETTQGLVRITDNADALITDTSAAVFAIILPTISITSPNGGESWYATGAYDITWASVGSVSNNLKLEYTLNGTSWTQFATGQADSGTYAWTVPDSASLTCKVRITDNTRLTVTDTSNADFSIVLPTITLTSPNGAEEWAIGTAHDITWTSVGANNSIKNNLTIQYSKDNFATPIAIAAGEANDGVRGWTIPDDVSATVKVKIFDASRPATQDTSDANFSITQPYVRITAPNGGESWVIGTAHNITWISLGAISNNLTIEYSKDNFATAAAIAAAEANDGAYAWTVPDDVSSTAKVRVTDADRPAVTDRSDGSFVIANSILTVTRPNGAELFTDGDTENITWTSTGTVSNDLKLDYSKDNFATAGILIATGLSNSGTYPWTVPSDISATVRVRITDNARPAVWDKSNAGFTILPVPQITIVSPNGGETWRVGSIYTISWSDNGGVVSNNLTVQYSIDGANWIGISTGEANDGSYSWTIPDNVSVSASVRVYDASRPSNSDVSDLAFSIALPLINITSPNGGEVYAVGDAPVITWTTEGAVSENLTLEYTTDGTIFNLIASAQANTGSYAWTIPDFVSTSVKIRITDGNRPVVSDLSNANFTVIQYPTVTVTAPNGGEVYTIGDILPVAWSYQGLSINPLTLSYSRDNFVTSSVIATGVVHTARSYNWVIPDNALAGNTLKLKIYDPARVIISDTSNANFRIKGGFTITAPLVGGRFIAKKLETISWANRGVAANVKLEYSIDSGANWNTIVASLSNTGSYTWRVADSRTAGNTVQVRISDVTDPTINAVSGLFKIDYYTISWRVLDYDTNAPLQLLSVKDTFWSDQTNTLTSPLDHDYPYGAYTTFWSKEGYIERAMEWTADSDKTITVTLENQITAAVEWHVLLSSSYSADTDILKVSTWLERRGKLVGTTATDLTDLQSATVEVFDGTTALKSMTVNTHDSQGVFWFNWDSTGLAAGKTYFVRSSITYRSSTYTSGSAVDVTAAKKQLEDKIQMQAIQTQVDTTRVAVDTGTAEIKSKIDDTKASVETKVAEVKGETTKILAATEQTLPAKIEEARAEVETTRKSEILNRENTVRTGQALNIRFRTYPGLSPALDVYNKDNVLKIDKAAMKEVGATGIYEYEVKFVSNWGKGDFTIVCSESTKGTMDALIVTVLSTDVEEISGQVSAVLGTTSGLSDVKSLADNLSSQFNIIETSLSKVATDLAKDVKDAVSSFSSLESIYTQISNVAKEVKNISGEAGINLQKLYEVSTDKKQDINYLKNKTQQLKAAMALNQKTVDNIANKPLTQTWYEYK